MTYLRVQIEYMKESDFFFCQKIGYCISKLLRSYTYTTLTEDTRCAELFKPHWRVGDHMKNSLTAKQCTCTCTGVLEVSSRARHGTLLR